jgi:endoglucanase
MLTVKKILIITGTTLAAVGGFFFLVRVPHEYAVELEVGRMPASSAPTQDQVPPPPSSTIQEPQVLPLPVGKTSLPEAQKAPSTLTDADCAALKNTSPFFFDSGMQAARVERELRAQGKTEEAGLLRDISCVPQAVWLVGGLPQDVRRRAADFARRAAEQKKILVLVLYNAPQHGSLEWGSGVGDGAAYRAWIEAIAEGIGSERDPWILLEPDALGLAYDLSSADRTSRLAQIKEAAAVLKQKAPRARVYLDGGHSAWKPVEKQAELMEGAGIGFADGFYTNVSNYKTLAAEIAYGKELSAELGGKRFLIDTSRNGAGPAENEWCNSRGRALGERPSVETGDPLLQAYLWVKLPGESDGTCNGGPAPGKFWLDIALEMIRNRRAMR